METLRRLLAPTLVAFAVTVVLTLVYVGAFDGGIDSWELGAVLLFPLGVVLAVLVVVLLAVGLLRLFGVRSLWAALGLAFVVVAAGCLLYYVLDTVRGQSGEQWNLLFLVVTAIATIPSWLAYAAGLALSDWRNRRAPNPPEPAGPGAP
ncbi:hypothetical protein [Promicromonospora iranensis]|uniref:Membrane protease YdiL (CAAX protease family) n=1 Tax=Promicromonospora iranensis TaxID=1105144 RepID=A0ABU2CSP3_9MICO|nr:hypothetical protein [Promicromonospora iranensis]MDR7384358.1 membrane protease YdiL (CAAX protease family) [Promicromonospora iranensis]